MSVSEPIRTREDVEWATDFKALYLLSERCSDSEGALLLLSTCRNAFLTVNALFVELQVLLGDARSSAALRGGCELMIQRAAPSKIKERFGRAMIPVREFEKKEAVWRARKSIWSDIDTAAKQLREQDLLAAERANNLLKMNNIAPDLWGDGWSFELLEINLAERQHLEAYFTDLRFVFTLLRCAVELGWHTANALNRDRQETLNFGNQIDSLDPRKSLDLVLKCATDLANACGWRLTTDSGQPAILIIRGYERPSNTPRVDSIILPRQATFEYVNDAIEQLGLLIREVLYFAHSKLCEKFDPNIGKPPMPPPFEIALPMPLPTLESGRGAPFELERVRCSMQEVQRDSVRIAVASMKVPLSMLSGRGLKIKPDKVESIKKDVRLALHEAQMKACQGIVFPEYSLPLSIAEEILELSSKHNLVIIAGLEGRWIDNELCGQALVAIPGERKVYFQCKQDPSLDEENRELFYRDGKLLFFVNSPIGDFSVVVCNDFRQIDYFQAWKSDGPLPELLFVVARNPYHEMFFDLAKADANRLYAGVVIANVREIGKDVTSEGSCVVVPRKDCQELSGERVTVEGNFVTDITVYDVSLHAIRARSRGKPVPGYFSVPRSAQRS